MSLRITQADIEAYNAQRARIAPIAATLGIDLDQAERNDDHQLLHALGVISRHQQQARASQSGAPGSQLAAARTALAELRGMHAQHSQQQPAGGATLSTEELGAEVARRILAMPGRSVRPVEGG